MNFKNRHAHILTTMRPIGENGKWEAKTEKEYICIKDGIEKAFTGKELKDSEGWQKQFQYKDDKKKIWLTDAEGRERGLKRINNSPKSTRYGRHNAKTERWNSKEQLLVWRKMWEETANEYLKSLGIEAQIDARSLASQGIDREPTVHMGPTATQMERQAAREEAEGKSLNEIIHSDLYYQNRYVYEYNTWLDEMIEFFKSLFRGIGRVIDIGTGRRR